MIPGPGEPGNETWPGETWKTGGATTWQTGAYDAETKTLLWGTGNPGPWNSDLRKGDNKWSCSLVAMDVDTGKIKWAFQYTPNDAWDYDGNNAPALLDVTIDGKPRKVAVQATATASSMCSTAITGEFIYAVPTDRRHQLDERPRPQDRPADRQRGQAAEERRRQGRAHRSRLRRRHQLVPDGLRSRQG